MKRLFVAAISAGLIACSGGAKQNDDQAAQTVMKETEVELSEIDKKLLKYVEVELTTDVSKLSEEQKKLIPLLIEVGKIMDGLFWQEAYGDKSDLLSSIADEKVKRFTEINYGPWD